MSLERDPLPDLNVHEDLGRADEARSGGQGDAGGRDGGGDVEAGEGPVPGRRQVGADEVPRLLAAEEGAVAVHLLDDVAVADGGADEPDPAGGERLLEPPVRHDGPDDGVGLLPLPLELERPEEEDVVAVEDRPSPSASIARSASPSSARPRSAPAVTTAFAIASGWRAPQPALMFLPSGETARRITSAPARRNASGATRKAAPLAQSRTTFSPSSRAGSVSTRCVS